MQKRKRNHSFVIRLNNEEYNTLNKLVNKSGLSREAYLRALIGGVVPMPALPIDYHKMIYELNAIGNNLNQLVRKTNKLNVVDAITYKEFADSLDKMILAIMSECMIAKKTNI